MKVYLVELWLECGDTELFVFSTKELAVTFCEENDIGVYTQPYAIKEKIVDSKESCETD